MAKAAPETLPIHAILRGARAMRGWTQPELRRQETEAKKRLTALRALLQGDELPPAARAAVRAIFPRGLRASPVDTQEGKRWVISGDATMGGMAIIDTEEEGHADDRVPPRGGVPSGIRTRAKRRKSAYWGRVFYPRGARDRARARVRGGPMGRRRDTRRRAPGAPARRLECGRAPDEAGEAVGS